MIILIAGASHTGKTALAQKLLERHGYPYLSIDHLKMGLIRSGHTSLTPLSDEKDLTEYLWPIVREMIKTTIIDGEFYHYDTPLTVKHEMEALLAAGFSSIEVLRRWGATHTIKAVK